MASDATAQPPLDLGLRARLSIMMFLQFAIWGAWFVVFFDYLLSLGFTGQKAGWIFGNMALGAIISPMIVGLIADRFLASEKLMAILHLGGAGLLYWMATMTEKPAFEVYFAASLIYALVYNPTLSLANSISFSNIPDGTRDFPGIRVWGTIGWIVVNFIVGKWLDIGTNQPLMLAAALSVALGVFSLMLPHTPPTGKSGDPLPFIKAFALFKDPSFAVFFAVSGIITIVLAFYYSNTATFLKSLDPAMVPESVRGYFVKTDANPPFINPSTTMLIGQIVEMIVLPLLPIFLWRLGMKWVLALGMVSWGIRYFLFAQASPFSAILIGVALHGICFDFFFAAGFIHVDNEAPKDIRASGQALFALLTYGIGMWLGSVLSGWLKDHYTDPITKVVNWHDFWMVPSIGVFVAVVVFVVFFRIRRKAA